MTRLSPNLRRRMALGALLTACCLLPPAFSQPPIEPPDPLPIKRIPVVPDRVGAEMARLGLTVVDNVPIDEFDARLRRARTAGRSAPHLVEARYFGAELSGDSLVGKGNWKVLHGDGGPAVLPLQPLTVAVRQPRFDTRDALLADFEGQGTGLLVEGSGEQTVNFDWSARQEPSAEGMQFQLGLPACPVASLELDLPANLLVSADGLPVTGPGTADKPQLKRWRVSFSGRPSLTLTLRRRPEAGEPRVLLAGHLLSRLNLTPGSVEADFTFDHLKVLSGEVRELTCALDPSLRPHEVTAPEIDNWTFHEPASPGAPGLLTIRLREPLLSGSLIVHCSALLGGTTAKGAPPESQPWTAPGLRLVDAVAGGETLVLHLQPDVSLDAWDAGGFRLVEAKGDADGQMLRLIGGLIDGADGKPAGPNTAGRPSARVRSRGIDFRAREAALWRADPEHPSFTAQFNFEVLRGRLFVLPLELPAGYEDIESIETVPLGQVRNFEVRVESGKTILLVRLAQSLGPDAKLKLTIRLRSPTPPHAALAWAIPDLVPVGARLREGGLAIAFDPLRFEGRFTGVAPTATPADEDGPWRPEVPDYYVAYRGEPPHGRLELRPRPPSLRARASCSVVLAPGRAAAETTLQLQADAGMPQSLDVYVSAPIAGAWDWKTPVGGNGVASFERLPAPEAAAALSALAARDALGVAALLAVPRGEWRRLTLRQPLRPPDSLKLQAVTGLARGPAGRWDVPLIAVSGADVGEGEVALYLPGADLVRIETMGLREAQPAPGRAGAAPPWRTFRYSEPPVALTLQGPAPAPGRSAGAAIDRAFLTTTIEPDGRLINLFRFQTWGWPEPSLPLRLPVGARLHSVKVNGLWVDRLPPAAEEEGVLRVDLPVPERGGLGDAGLRRYEIVYVSDAPAAWLGSRLEAPMPGLPLPPLAFQRRWRLPPGMLPLYDGRVRALPAADTEPDGPIAKDLGALSWDVLRPLALEGWEERQRQQVIAAARAARPAGGRASSLGEALERVACDAAVEHEPLVIDTAALEEAGLTSGTVLAWPVDAGKDAAPFWEALGLVHVPCRPAPLLTTRRRLDDWKAAGGDAETVPPSIEAAVAVAAVNGHDTSGRFLWAVSWARRRAPTARFVGSSLFGPVTPGWTEWEPVAGSEVDAELTTVRRAPVRAAGIALAVGLVAAFWGLRRRAGRLRLALLLLWLGAAGTVILWLPVSLHGLAWGSLLVGGTLGLGWYLWSAARVVPSQSAPSSHLSARGVAAAGVLALLIGGAALVVQAAPPGPVRSTVLVLAGPADAPERQVVLASPDLLKQIDALATAGTPHGAAIIAATYEGKSGDDHVEFEARLQVHNFEDGPVTLPLPFADVRLQDDGLLDGAPARLIAAPPGQTGLLLKIEKPGAHRLVLHFRVPVTANGSEREAHFRAPRVPQSQLTLDVPASATWVQAVTRQGSLTRSDSAPGATVAHYAVELGRIDGPLLLRWQEEATGTPAPVLRVREAYLWSLRPDAASLTAVLLYTVTRGAPTALALELPEGLEVQGVEVRSTEGGRPAPSLKPWHIETSAGKRRLRLEFAAPVTPGVYVVAHLTPRRPLSPLATLPIPTPLDVQFAGGLLAYRADGVEARVANSGRLRGPYGGAAGVAESKAFADLCLAAGEGSLPSLPAPHALQREAGGEPFLQVALRVVPPPVRGSQEIVWRVGARQADLRATARLTAPGGDLSFVEWEVPADVVVTHVGGRDDHDPIWQWSRTSNRVQAWLDHTMGVVDVELDGWKELAQEKDGARFDLPGVRLLSARAATTSVRLTPTADLVLTAEDTQSLLPLPDPRSSECYAPRGPAYGGRFRIRRAALGAEARILTTAEVVAGQLAFTSHIEYRSDGDGHSVEVLLRHWDSSARLDVKGARRRDEVRRPGGEHSWVIELPAGPGRAVTLTLTGTKPLPAGADGVAFPDVSVIGTARQERWLAANRHGLATDQVKQLSDVPAIPQTGTPLPAAGRGEATRLLADGGALWKVTGPDWSLRLLPQRGPEGTAPVRVVLTERVSAVVDGRHWAHEAVVWLYHEANTDLNVSLPKGARVLGVTVDGLAVTPLQASAESLWVPLPGAAGARRVRLRWAFDPDSEPLDRPRLQRPRLLGAADGPVVWTVHVPAEYTAFRGPEEERGQMAPAGPAALDLARAEAQYGLSAALAESPGAPQEPALALAQRRFYQFCRYAEAGRLLNGNASESANLQGKSFDDWLRELREKNGELARTHKFEELRAKAERDAVDAAPLALEPATAGELPQLAGVDMVQAPGPRGDPLPERGTPLRWQTGAKTDAPGLLLTPQSDQQTKRAFGLSVLLVLLLLAVWALAHLPGMLAWVRAFWPEQLALLGCLGWQTYGPALPLLLLVAVGVSARLLFLGRRLLALIHRPPSDPSHGGSNKAGISVEPRPSGT
jgi:hypothetical protein